MSQFEISFGELAFTTNNYYKFIGQIAALLELPNWTQMNVTTDKGKINSEKLDPERIQQIYDSWIIRPDEPIFDTHIEECANVKIESDKRFNFLIPTKQVEQFVEGYQNVNTRLGRCSKIEVISTQNL